MKANQNSSLATEEALLGLLLKNNELVFDALALLDENAFTNEKNKEVFKVLSLLKTEIEADKGLDDILIAETAFNSFKLILDDRRNPLSAKYSKSEVANWNPKEWHDYLSLLVYSAGFKSQFDNYIKTLLEKKRLRSLGDILMHSYNNAGNNSNSSQNVITSLQQELLNLSKDIELKDFVDIASFSEDFHNKLINQTFNENNIKTGINSLDKLISGFNPGDLVILAARPSMGKTAFALEVASNIAMKKNVAFFSIEMPNEQLVQRLLASFSNVFLNKIKSYASLSQQQKSGIEAGIEYVSELKLWLDDTPGLRINELVWKARKLNSMHKLDMIVIDYLQLIETSGRVENRNQQVSEISRTLKALARELRLPIIALSQLSRRVEQREDKRPIMSDIRESGSIEQDADLIMFLYRENYYKTKKEGNAGSQDEDVEVIISKHRNGPTGMVVLKFNPSIGKFDDRL